MLLLLYIFSLCYLILITFFITGIFRLKTGQSDEIKALSVIIAARNEEKNIPLLLNALEKLEYPSDRFEIIIIDDRSTDRTKKLVEDHLVKLSNLRLISVKQEDPGLVGKKGAIYQGILAASHDHLVFTDADCLPGRKWLHEINKNWSDKIDFWAGYSPLVLKNKFLYLLKNLERASIFAITAGSFGWGWGVTCTARNMGYRKSVFFASGGFKGIGRIASGDDDLLLQKMAKKIRRYNFLFSPEASVWARDRNSGSDQIQLETRRGSKWKYYPLPIKLLSLFVFLYYLLITAAIFSWLLGVLSFIDLFIMILIKIIPEFLLLYSFLKKVKRTRLLRVFPIAEMLYIPYFIFFGVKGTLGKYRWK